MLDVGTGSGALAFAVRDVTKTTRITGIDPSAVHVTRAQTSHDDPRIRFEVGDDQDLRFPAAQFDTTLSLLVMNFIPDRERALGEMIRVTKPGGPSVCANGSSREDPITRSSCVRAHGR